MTTFVQCPVARPAMSALTLSATAAMLAARTESVWRTALLALIGMTTTPFAETFALTTTTGKLGVGQWSHRRIKN